MTDNERFSLIERIKSDIRNMGFDIDINKGKSIKISTPHYIAIWKDAETYNVWTLAKTDDVMDQLKWEDFSGEIDNLDRAILWVNTELKSIVFDL